VCVGGSGFQTYGFPEVFFGMVVLVDGFEQGAQVF
jgi:hypothetical protein